MQIKELKQHGEVCGKDGSILSEATLCEMPFLNNKTTQQ